jgi:hypothetical protein
MTDTELKIAGIDALLKALGDVQTERFIALLLREPFDYTVWQRTLWQDQTVEEISQAAMARRRTNDRTE